MNGECELLPERKKESIEKHRNKKRRNEGGGGDGECALLPKRKKESIGKNRNKKRRNEVGVGGGRRYKNTRRKTIEKDSTPRFLSIDFHFNL